MKKRLFSILLALCMVLCLVPTTAFAESETEETPVCSCETACTAEAMNADCPICGAEGALPENCAKCAQPADDAVVQPEGEVSDPQPEGEVSDPQPEGKVSDPQPETALTSLIGGNETAKDVSTAEELTAAIADVNFDTVRLTGDISISSTLTVNRTVTLDLNGHVLKYESANNGSVIVVENGGQLTIEDSNTSNLSHKFMPNGKLWVLDDASGTEAVTGGVITGGTGTDISTFGGTTWYCGGGALIKNGGSLTMRGGNIIGCSAECGGGVCIDSEQGQFSMSGGSIAGCVASDIGGGVFASGTFKMSGQAVIRSCTAESATQYVCGGGVYVNVSSSFEMSDTAIIEGCQAISTSSNSSNGGGVYVSSSSSFVMSNEAKIEGCQAISNSSNSSNGGGVYLANNTKFTLSGNAVIQNCTATNSANSGEAYGGGVSAACVKEITLADSARIVGCAAANGSGLYITGSQVPGYGILYANSGSVDGDVVLGDTEDGPSTITGSGGTVFNGKVTVTPGSTIKSGTFNGEVINNGTITGGVFNNTVSGSGTITGGIFNTPMTGSGTETDPYQISTAEQLKLFRDIVNGAGGQTQNRGAYAVLTADIDLNNEPWTPIGPDRDSAYTGTFDGQGHTVKNLSVTVNVQPGRAGLFGCVKDGTIRKLTVAGSVSCTANQGWCGGIAGYAMDETIENCASLCTVSCTGIDARVGGIVGLVDYNSRTLIIRDCYNIGKITGRSDNGSGDAGGICGFYMNGKISNCYNVGEITGSGYVSKIAVSAYNDSRPTNCYYLSDTDTDLNGTAKTAAEFADGTVLEELKAGQRDNNADPWADECQYLDAAGKTLPVFNGQGDAHDHQSNDWKSNETEHWQVCTCGAVFHKAEHSGGTATCTQRATCTVCGAEYGDVLGHDFTTSWTHDDNMHWKQCSRCDKKDDVSPHTWDSGTVTTAPTCTKAGERTYTCTECGATKTEPIDATGHSWKSEWTSDATHHWHECANESCDVTDNAGKNGYAEHSGGKATCTQNAVCEICKASYGSLDPNNHTDLKHIDAKAATAAEEGNIAYWYCDGCKKYFSDAAAIKEITKAATVTAKLPPKITAGDGAAVTQGEKKELTFTSDASFADFVRVELDGTALEEKNYTKREGSTIITLNRDFVAALSVGEHTLAIVSQHGTATAKFTVKAKPTGTATPQPTVTPQRRRRRCSPTPTVQPVSPILGTGDTANPALWFALLIVSGGAAIGTTIASRKKKHNK
ncbi:pectate lyase-like adhesive domain-containing protein [Hominenteromicrobium sp.]|uniref:pectate lyase-like adhesive domain-containing protein n=1 Tax=Hominenteromicrobium sp. TaxID=3073581 RepID=UPI003999BE04